MSPADMRQHLASYADGELEPALREQVEAHLSANSADRADVERWRALRRCAQRAVNSEPVPGGLADRIRAGLHAPAGRGRFSSLGRVYRLGLPSLALAAVVFLALALWPRGAAGTPVDAAGFARVYRKCALTQRHDTFGIRDVAPSARFTRVSERAGFACAVPDLAACGPYRLDGACACSPSRDIRVVHAYFRNDQPQGGVVSVFAIDRRIELKTNGAVCPECRHGKRHYHAATDGDVSVVGFDDGQRSYVLAGQMKDQDLMQLADRARIAEVPPLGRDSKPSLANLHRR